jgi:protein O-GlcNAc transferase
VDVARLLEQGIAHHRAGRFHDAEVRYRQILAADPNHADACHLLGMIAHEAGQTGTAIDLVRRALSLNPQRPDFLNNLGTLYQAEDDLMQARACFLSALHVNPTHAGAHNNLGEVYKEQGLIREAVTSFREAGRCDPANPRLHSNLLYTLQFDPDTSVQELFAEHLKWGQQHFPASPGHPGTHRNDRDPERPLRIGYVSPDFRYHATMRFFSPILENHDRQQFQIFLYGEVARPDETTRRLQSLAQGWRRTAGRSAQEVAQLIRHDQIDLLIDLAGHTVGNRLDVFALKPAPVQITYLDYPCTTGLATIDYRLTDAILDPPDRLLDAAEQPWHLQGCLLCFVAAEQDRALPLAPPPYLETGTITFASTHQIFKLNDAVLRLWKELLDLVPSSRLAFIRSTLSPARLDLFRQRLRALGMPEERIVFRRPGPRSDYLHHAAEVDILLDAFPFSGHTTSCEYLWMGVPVVTFRADRPAGRVTASILHALGLEELIANSPEEYLARARRLAGDRARLTQLRQELRPRMQQHLGAGLPFTRRLEQAYRDMWRKWVSAYPTPSRSESKEPIAPRRGGVPSPPGNLEAWASMLSERSARGQLDEALALAQQMIQQAPHLALGYQHLGQLLLRHNQPAEAEQAFLRALALEPDQPAHHARLASLRQQQGRLLEALVGFGHLVRLDPDNPRAQRMLGTLLFDMGQPVEAVASLQQANQLAEQQGQPSAEALNDLGNALRQLERNEEAVTHYRRALEVQPGFPPAHANLANLLAEQGRTEEARQAYREAHRHQPQARLRVLAETLLPVVYQSMEQLHASRQQLTEAVAQLLGEGTRVDPTAELMPTHFYLAYQGMNDRDLLASLAQLGEGPRRVQLDPPRGSGQKKIRVGFLSRYFRNHTIGQLNLGLVRHLCRERFEVIVFSAGPADAGLGRRFQEAADRQVVLPNRVGPALAMLAEANLDILYWPDVGMDALTYTLAFSRLAPVQCVCWGHPVSTGLPTMDYFVTSTDLDPPGNEGHYTEQLLRLTRLPVIYERPRLSEPRKGRSFFALPEEKHLYLCPQTLFKFHPEFDTLLGNILRADPDGVLVLIQGKHPHWTELLQHRLLRTLPDVHKRILFLPAQRRDLFLQLLAVADVMLDPIHFGGGNTSYEGLAVGTPIVTLPSPFLRGRLTYALYRQMGLLDLVAHTPEEYVQQAVRLGTEEGYQATMRQRILETCGVLYEDVAVARELEELWVEAWEKSSGG